MSSGVRGNVGALVLTSFVALAGCRGDDANAQGASPGGAGPDAALAGSGAGGTAGASGGSSASGTGGNSGGDGGAPPGPGECAPSDGPDTEALEAEGKLELLLDSTDIVRSSFVQNGYLYFTEDDVGIRRISESTKSAEVLIPSTDTPGRLLGLEGGYLYFEQSYDGPYMRVPEGDWSATPVMQGGTPKGYAQMVSDGYLYGFDGGELWRQEFTSGSVEVLYTAAEQIGRLDVTADGFVYYTDDSFGVENLFRVPGAGGAREQLSEGSHFGLGTVRVLEGLAYWADGFGMYVTDPTIARATSTVSLGGYGPKRNTVGVGTRGAQSFMARGDRIYWVDDAGNVGWTSKDRMDCGAVYLQESFTASTVELGPDHAYVFDSDRVPSRLWRTPL